MNFLLYTTKNKTVASVELVVDAENNYYPITTIDVDFMVLSVFLQDKRSLVSIQNETQDYSNYIQQAFVNTDDNQDHFNDRDFNPAFTKLFFTFMSTFQNTNQELIDTLTHNAIQYAYVQQPLEKLFTVLTTPFMPLTVPRFECGLAGTQYNCFLYINNTMVKEFIIRIADLDQSLFILGTRITFKLINFKGNFIFFPTMLALFPQNGSVGWVNSGSSIISEYAEFVAY